MTTPIKPPGQGATPSPTSDVDASRAPGSVKAGGESFQSTLEKTSHSASATSTADAVRALVDDVKAGRATVGQALDRLVARALDSGIARTLPAAQRADLEASLRTALLDDPSLVALTKELERGR